MNFSQVLGLICHLVAINSSRQCLKGWDLSVALSEPELNRALHKVVSNFLLWHTLPTYNHKEDQTQPGQPWGMRNSVKLQGLRILSLHLAAIPSKQQEGKLEVTFRAGSLQVSQELAFPSGQTLNKGSQNFNMKNQKVNFKVRVTAYKAKMKNQIGERFTLMLEIVEDDAILGSLGWTLKDNTQTKTVREALSEKMKRELKLTKNFDLGSFDLPKRNRGDTSMVKDLFPKTIRFAFTYAPFGKSVIAALATTGTSSTHEGGFSWNVAELIPQGKGSAITISGAKLMRSLKPVIAKQLSISKNALGFKDTCPSKIYLKWRINDFHGKTDLKSLSLEMYGGNELQTELKMFDHVSPGITVDIFITVRLRLDFNNRVKRFDVSKSHQHHNTKYYREWWVWMLEIITLGIARLVTEIITKMADDQIASGMRYALDFDPRKGGMPLNIGGVLGEVFDRMYVQSINFSNDNLVFPFDIKW